MVPHFLPIFRSPRTSISHSWCAVDAFVLAVHNIYLAVHDNTYKGLEMTKLSNRARLGRFSSIFATFGAAIDVSRAVEAGQMPASGSLEVLGIDQSAFRHIQRS